MTFLLKFDWKFLNNIFISCCMYLLNVSCLLKTKMMIKKGLWFNIWIKNLIRLINYGFKTFGLALLRYYETQL